MVPVAVVTGAQRGIGKETARQLLQLGFSVVVGALDAAEGEATAEELAESGTVRSVELDVTDDHSIETAFADIADEFAALDVLVNNAGITGLGSAVEITRAQLHSIFEVNTFGPAMVTKAAIPLLRKSDRPRIVNVSSGGGSLTRGGEVDTSRPTVPILAYAAAKCALNMITVQTNLTLQSDPDLRHIKINAVTPGTTKTHVSGFKGQPIPEGARVVVKLATIDDDGPTGGFFDISGPLPW
jgi:NAD(P)-dependent dehydrogenase (short-subunit alcohol dehydrogenase family)